MNRIYAALFALVILTACENKPLPAAMLEPPAAVYGQLETGTYLTDKVAVREFKYQGKAERLAPLFLYTNIAVSEGLQKAGLLASSPSKVKYTISGVIKDVGFPQCLFANCDTGSAIEYTMTNQKEDVVYHELLVVPYTYDIPIMGGNEVLILQQGFGGAIGNNIAHLLHVLNQKTKSDLEEGN
jgi:hypothetical protein